jgi:hypothetical protein
MSDRGPALVRAELLARIHYGLPPVRQSLTGHPRGVHKTVAGKLESGGFVHNGRPTEQAYIELAEVCRRLGNDHLYDAV